MVRSLWTFKRTRGALSVALVHGSTNTNGTVQGLRIEPVSKQSHRMIGGKQGGGNKTQSPEIPWHLESLPQNNSLYGTIILLLSQWPSQSSRIMNLALRHQFLRHKYCFPWGHYAQMWQKQPESVYFWSSNLKKPFLWGLGESVCVRGCVNMHAHMCMCRSV